MPQGFVTTARGEILNMDELKTKSTMPIADKKQPGREVKKQTLPKRQPLNVRGYVPQQGEAKTPEVPEEIVAAMNKNKSAPSSKTIRSSFTDTGEAKSLADVTGVKVNKPSQATKEKVKAAMESEQRPSSVSEEALGDILSELGQSNPKASSAADEEEKSTRRSRSKKE